MTNRWEGCIKLHEHCGGLVRWVEAVHTPGVGYYGECTGCSDSGLVVEDIVPVEVPSGERFAAFKERADGIDDVEVSWNDDADWDTNQERLQEQIA